MTDRRISFRRKSANDTLALQFWVRTLSFGVDIMVLRYVLIPLVVACLSFTFNVFGYESEMLLKLSDSNIFFNNHTALGYLLIFTVFGIYTSLLECSRLQGTLGKMLFRLKVITVDGKRITFTTALLRYILKIVTITTIIGVYIIDMNKKRQGLHDIILKTKVYRR